MGGDHCPNWRLATAVMGPFRQKGSNDAEVRIKMESVGEQDSCFAEQQEQQQQLPVSNPNSAWLTPAALFIVITPIDPSTHSVL